MPELSASKSRRPGNLSSDKSRRRSHSSRSRSPAHRKHPPSKTLSKNAPNFQGKRHASTSSSSTSSSSHSGSDRSTSSSSASSSGSSSISSRSSSSDKSTSANNIVNKLNKPISQNQIKPVDNSRATKPLVASKKDDKPLSKAIDLKAANIPTTSFSNNSKIAPPVEKQNIASAKKDSSTLVPKNDRRSDYNQHQSSRRDDNNKRAIPKPTNHESSNLKKVAPSNQLYHQKDSEQNLEKQGSGSIEIKKPVRESPRDEIKRNQKPINTPKNSTSIEEKTETSKVSQDNPPVKTCVIPEITKIYINRLTRNVLKAHVEEIFSCYGKIKSIEFPSDRFHPEFGKGYAYVEYEIPKPDSSPNIETVKQSDSCEINSVEQLTESKDNRDKNSSLINPAMEAILHMNGGQIDGQEISVTQVKPTAPQPPPISQIDASKQPLSSTRRRSRSPPRRPNRVRSPHTPIRGACSPNHRYRDRRRRYSPSHRRVSPGPPRRPVSNNFRGGSPPTPPYRYRRSPRQMGGSARSPLPPRRGSVGSGSISPPRASGRMPLASNVGDGAAGMSIGGLPKRRGRRSSKSSSSTSSSASRPRR